MKVLVVGSGGREHALCWKIAKSTKVRKIYCAPGNGGTRDIAESVDIKANEIDRLLNFALRHKIDLTVVGPEDPLAKGIVDKFQSMGLTIFGPNKLCAQLEASKEFSKLFMQRHNIPTARYKSYTEYEKAIRDLGKFDFPLVIKADGLCMGKGVVICKNQKEAVDTLDEILNKQIFGKEGSKVIIEEFLEGIEASLLCFVTEGKIIPLESAKDYKKILENDLGPNTGGVGCYSPSPLFSSDLKDNIAMNVLDKISIGFEKDKMHFKGILFIGFMIKNDKVKVLEFNVRFGDPETQVLIPRLKSDIIDLFLKTIDGTLETQDLLWINDPCLTLILTSAGYPGPYDKGYEIKGVEELDESILLFHNGTLYNKQKLLTNGGRVISVTSLGKTIEQAREKIYSNVEKIQFEGMCYRKDIGKDI